MTDPTPSAPPDKHFRFPLDQPVAILISGEEGIVIGRADYSSSEDTYLIRYEAADGRACENWWGDSALIGGRVEVLATPCAAMRTPPQPRADTAVVGALGKLLDDEMSLSALHCLSPREAARLSGLLDHWRQLADQHAGVPASVVSRETPASAAAQMGEAA